MHPTYAPNNNPNQEVVVNVDVEADADAAMIPTSQPTPTSPLNDELGSSNREYFDAKNDTLIGDGDSEGEREGDGDGEEIDDNSDGDDNHFNRCKKEEERQRFLKTDKLYKAALKGDWKTAKSIFDIDPSAVTMKLTDDGETALDIATTSKQTAFAEKLVNLMSSSDITSANLRFAATSGELRIVEVLVEKNPALPNIYDLANPYSLPLLLAVISYSKDIAFFLFSKTNFETLQLSRQTSLLLITIVNDYYDLALEILKKNPRLAKERYGKSNNQTALHILARKANAIGSSGNLSFWKRCITYGFKGFYNKALMQTLAHQLVEMLWNVAVNEFTAKELLEFINTPLPLLDVAASVGNVEFLIILLNSYPYLILKVPEPGKKSIFHTAIEYRQESVFSLIYEIGAFKSVMERPKNIETNWNMLELAGKVAEPNLLNKVSGAALQMQRELSWFKEVENIVHPNSREVKEKIERDGKTEMLTPRQLFTKEHKQLLKDGEEWMKNTANSCMLVATLIATVVFAAAFTVPGGIDNNTGTPIFKHKDSFTIFIISDVTALVSSTTSILIFLSILTSRYTEDDFLVSLPRKLLFGIVTLFFSIVCMIVAFSATIFMVYDKAKSEILSAIIVGAIIPVCCFCVLHTKLVLDILRSTGWFGFSSRFRKRRLFI